MMTVIMLTSVVMLSIIMLQCHYAECFDCHYSEYHNDDCHYALNCDSADCDSGVSSCQASLRFQMSQYLLSLCHFGGWHYAE
jgi:hypothetical protein